MLEISELYLVLVSDLFDNHNWSSKELSLIYTYIFLSNEPIHKSYTHSRILIQPPNRFFLYDEINSKNVIMLAFLHLRIVYIREESLAQLEGKNAYLAHNR